ncbi:MAG: hypothetical protein BYD32DRAFT_436806 [Podila humilis]|nr:MAG: hypothetical protein BYD32DRAFT_436806 [Podila humilis]
MSDAATPPPSFDLYVLLAKIDSLSRKLDEQEQTIINLKEASTTEGDLCPRKYPALQEQYPAIMQTNFFNTVLPKGHDHFDWSDFHFTEGMEYKPPPVMEHQVIVLPDAPRKHELDLARIQECIANATRMYDTFTDEIVDSNDVETDLGQRTLAFLNTLRILASNDASKISVMHKDIYLRQMQLSTTAPQQNAILTLDEVATRRAMAELVAKTYSKPRTEDSKKPAGGKKSKFKKMDPQSPDKHQDKKSDFKKQSDDTRKQDNGGKSGGAYKHNKSRGKEPSSAKESQSSSANDLQCASRQSTTPTLQ